MKLPRRKFLHLAAGAAALPTMPQIAFALDYPTRPVHLVVTYPAGGPVDLVARLLGQWLSERLGRPFVIENRPGAGGTVGTELVVRAPPDGYTLLSVGSTNTINATLYDNLSYNFIRDIAPVASTIHTPLIMVVSPSFPPKTVPEFIAYAKANPGKIDMASAGIGTAGHVAGELFKMMTGISMVHVPYRGVAPAMTALLGEQVQVLFLVIPGTIGYVRAGKLRALAVTTATRSDTLPDIPTVGEFVPSYEASSWMGIGAPNNSPAEIIDKLNEQINAGLADSKLKAQLTDLGATPMTMTPVAFGKFIAEETEKWAKVIQFADIKLE
jgi:tripartite-type tricarboxylate transporter receptor subunit TctC